MFSVLGEMGLSGEVAVVDRMEGGLGFDFVSI